MLLHVPQGYGHAEALCIASYRLDQVCLSLCLSLFLFLFLFLSLALVRSRSRSRALSLMALSLSLFLSLKEQNDQDQRALPRNAHSARLAQDRKTVEVIVGGGESLLRLARCV